MSEDRRDEERSEDEGMPEHACKALDPEAWERRRSGTDPDTPGPGRVFERAKPD